MFLKNTYIRHTVFWVMLLNDMEGKHALSHRVLHLVVFQLNFVFQYNITQNCLLYVSIPTIRYYSQHAYGVYKIMKNKMHYGQCQVRSQAANISVFKSVSVSSQ